jgi:hypothetical protein
MNKNFYQLYEILNSAFKKILENEETSIDVPLTLWFRA